MSSESTLKREIEIEAKTLIAFDCRGNMPEPDWWMGLPYCNLHQKDGTRKCPLLNGNYCLAIKGTVSEEIVCPPVALAAIQLLGEKVL